MDKESLLREKERQIYEQMRQRPRPKQDAPHLSAIFSPGQETLTYGLGRFHYLISSFVGLSPYFENWIVVRTQEEQENGNPLEILRNKNEHLSFLRSRGASDARFSVSALATSKQIDNETSLDVTATCNYSGGLEENRFDNISLGFYTPLELHENLTLQEYLSVIRNIVEWREPRMVSVGNSYATYDRVFWNRAWDGWIGWFPQEINPRVLPDFALTWRIGNGTAVATQKTNVLSRFPDQKEKANELEIALVEAGILPTETELKGDR
ncbi:MAG: hypothetical protein ACK5NN_05000 [Sphingomonadaceae bacterium]